MSEQTRIVSRWRATGLHGLVLTAAAFSILAGCASSSKVFKKTTVPARPSEEARSPLPPVFEPESATPELPENWEEVAQQLTLADIIDIGLANNPNTRATWLATRAAAAQVGVERADYFPKLDLDAEVSHVTQ